MAFTGRPALEAVDENAGLDAWAAKALDGLALTPTPAVQKEVSQDPFTGSCKDAESSTRHTYLTTPLQNALNPECKDFDAEFRRAWMNLDKQTRREIENH